MQTLNGIYFSRWFKTVLGLFGVVVMGEQGILFWKRMSPLDQRTQNDFLLREFWDLIETTIEDSSEDKKKELLGKLEYFLGAKR